MLTVIIETELLFVAAACFLWAAKGYTHIDWRMK